MNGNIVARPFSKFFNWEEYEGPLPNNDNEPFEVYEKMDGSLGIVYFVNDKPRIATRGNFDSQQSEWAMEMLDEKYTNVRFDLNITYLVEIIHPKNKIIVNYGNTRALILLGMIETKSGIELPLEDIGLPLVKKYDDLSSTDDDIRSLATRNEQNKEGFVVRYSSGLRFKGKLNKW